MKFEYNLWDKKAGGQEMKRAVNRLPKNAVFDFTNIFGEKVYHTERRCYYVRTLTNFGKKTTLIISQSRIKHGH